MKIGIVRMCKTMVAVVAAFALLLSPMATTAQAATKDIKAPTTPASLKVTSVGTTSVTLSWKGSTDNVGLRNYCVYRNSKYFTYSTTTSKTVTGLTPGTTYTFYIRAQDKAGNFSKASNRITVTTKSASRGTVATTAAPTGRLVTGYYASWAAYDGFTPSDIPAANLTHILYAFANINSDYKIALGDPEVDESNFAELRALKSKYPQLKTLISVGGWTWSERFSDMALTDARRTAFANSVVAFIKQYGFDGVDIDWEYPVGGGESGNVERPADKQDFTALMAALRSALNAQGKTDGRSYLLSFAGGADTSYCNNVEMTKLSQYVDFGMVMTYDMHGSMDGYTDLNAPLYGTTSSSPNRVWSCDQAVQAWQSAGFPAKKLVMGVPFYGRIYTSVTSGGTGLYHKYKTAKSIDYDDIVSGYLNKSGYTRHVGAAARTPWLFNGSTFISYDDAASMAEKASYIKSKGLAGAGIWELSENANGVLLGALSSGLR